MKNRLVRVRELIKRELGAILSRDYVFEALVTISDVDITPDLKQCHVYLGIVGNERQEEKVLNKLNRDRSTLQQKMAKRVVLKYTPRLHFKLDHSVERGVSVVNLMEGLDIPDDIEIEDDETDRD